MLARARPCGIVQGERAWGSQLQVEHAACMRGRALSASTRWIKSAWKCRLELVFEQKRRKNEANKMLSHKNKRGATCVLCTCRSHLLRKQTKTTPSTRSMSHKTRTLLLPERTKALTILLTKCHPVYYARLDQNESKNSRRNNRLKNHTPGRERERGRPHH